MATELTAILSADSSQLQQALNDAKTTLKKYKDEANGITKVSNQQIDSFNKSVNALNKLTNSSKSHGLQMSGLKKLIIELSTQYNALSQEVKNSDFGKALAGTINQATARFEELKKTANDVKVQLGETSGAVNNNKDVLDKLSGVVGVNIGSLTKFGGVLGVATFAVNEMKEAVFLNESAIDEWGRTIKAAEAAHNTFLHAINSGNWSGFFSNLLTAIRGARLLYNEFDRFNSIKSNNAAAIALVDAELAGLRKLKKEGKDVLKQIDNALARRKSLVNEGVQAGKTANRDAIAQNLKLYNPKLTDDAAKKQADLLLKGGLKTYDTAERTIKKIEKYAKDHYGNKTKSEYIDGLTVQRKLTKEEMMSMLPASLLSAYRTSKAVLQSETANLSYVSGYANAVQEGTSNTNSELKFTPKGGGGSKGGSTSGETELEKANRLAADVINKLSGKAKSSLFEIDNTLPEQTKKTEGKKIYNDDGSFYNPLADVLKDFGEVPDPTRDWNAKDIEAYNKALAQTTEEFDKLGSAQDAIYNVGSAFNSLGAAIGGAGGLWVSFVGTFADGVAKMLPQFVSLIAANQAAATAEGVKSGAGLPFPANLGAIASIVATIISIFASLPTFADGGILKGAASVGDFNVARVNDGEMILNGTLLQKLFNMLNSSGGYSSNIKNNNVEFAIKGKNLVGVLKNYDKKLSRL